LAPLLVVVCGLDQMCSRSNQTFVRCPKMQGGLLPACAVAKPAHPAKSARHRRFCLGKRGSEPECWQLPVFRDAARRVPDSSHQEPPAGSAQPLRASFGARAT
jgi:hypothetical protein